MLYLGFGTFALLMVVLLIASYLQDVVEWMNRRVDRMRMRLDDRSLRKRSTTKRRAEPSKTAAPPATSTADLPAPKWTEPKCSELWVHLVREGNPADGDLAATFVVVAQARVTGMDVPVRLVREVILTTVGADKIERAVHTINVEWKRKNGEDFLFRSGMVKPSVSDCNSKEWLEVLRVPANQLGFARGGKNALRASVTWRDGETGRRILQAEAACQIEVSESGYLDRKEEQTQVEWPSLRVVAAVLQLEQAPSAAAMKQLEQWLDGMTAKADRQPTMLAYRQARARRIIEEAGARSENERAAMARDSCRQLAKALNPESRANALEFFFRYAGITGKVTPKALSFAQQLTEWLEVPAQRARELRDKMLPVTMHVAGPATATGAAGEAGAEEALLGLRPGMSAEERRQHLNREYRKWNARADHPDARIREQARLMIEKIASLRQSAADNPQAAS